MSIIATQTESTKIYKQLLTDVKGENDKNIAIVGDLNTPLTAMDKSSRQKVNKEILALNNTLEHIALINIYRTFYPKMTEYTSFQVYMELSQ